MSMSYWTVTGYGVDEKELCPSVDSQIAFIKKYLPTQYKEMQEDGFNPEYFCQDGYGAVIYEDRLPWEMTDRVKNMKADDMSAIFKKYLDELGISASVSRQSVEFFG